MPSRLAVALLGISFVSGSDNCQPPTAAGPEHFEISAAGFPDITRSRYAWISRQ